MVRPVSMYSGNFRLFLIINRTTLYHPSLQIQYNLRRGSRGINLKGMRLFISNIKKMLSQLRKYLYHLKTPSIFLAYFDLQHMGFEGLHGETSINVFS